MAFDISSLLTLLPHLRREAAKWHIGYFDADDLVDEFLLCRGMTVLQQFDQCKGNLRNFVLGAFLFFLFNKLAKERSRTPRLSGSLENGALVMLQFEQADDDPLTAPAQATLHREKIQAINAAIKMLGDQEQIVVILHYWQGFTLAAIASALEISIAAAEKILQRARNKLRPLLQPFCPNS